MYYRNANWSEEGPAARARVLRRRWTTSPSAQARDARLQHARRLPKIQRRRSSHGRSLSSPKGHGVGRMSGVGRVSIQRSSAVGRNALLARVETARLAQREAEQDVREMRQMLHASQLRAEAASEEAKAALLRLESSQSQAEAARAEAEDRVAHCNKDLDAVRADLERAVAAQRSAEIELARSEGVFRAQHDASQSAVDAARQEVAAARALQEDTDRDVARLIRIESDAVIVAKHSHAELTLALERSSLEQQQAKAEAASARAELAQARAEAREAVDRLLYAQKEVERALTERLTAAEAQVLEAKMAALDSSQADAQRSLDAERAAKLEAELEVVRFQAEQARAAQAASEATLLKEREAAQREVEEAQAAAEEARREADEARREADEARRAAQHDTQMMAAQARGGAGVELALASAYKEKEQIRKETAAEMQQLQERLTFAEALAKEQQVALTHEVERASDHIQVSLVNLKVRKDAELRVQQLEAQVAALQALLPTQPPVGVEAPKARRSSNTLIRLPLRWLPSPRSVASKSPTASSSAFSPHSAGTCSPACHAPSVERRSSQEAAASDHAAQSGEALNPPAPSKVSPTLGAAQGRGLFRGTISPTCRSRCSPTLDEQQKRLQELEKSIALHKRSLQSVKKVVDRREKRVAEKTSRAESLHRLLQSCWRPIVLAWEARRKACSDPCNTLRRVVAGETGLPSRASLSSSRQPPARVALC